MATRRFEEEEDQDVVIAAPRRNRRVEAEEEEAEPTTKRSRKAVDEDEDETPSEPREVSVGIDVDFGDNRVTDRPGRLERLTLDGAKTARFAFIPGFKVKAEFNHYIEGQGTFICNCPRDEKGVPDGTGECCKKLGAPNMRAVALVVHYENAKSKDGSIAKNKAGEYEELEWSIKSLRMSRTNFAEISKKRMEDETLYDFDLTISEKESGIGYQFEKISKTPFWELDEDVEAAVLAAAEKFRDGKALSWGLGKKIDNLEYKSLLRKAAKAEQASSKDEEEI